MLEINCKLVSGEIGKLLFNVVKTEFYSLHYNILHCLLWDTGSRAWIWGCFKQLIKMCRRLRNETATSKNNFGVSHMSRPMPYDSLSVRLFSVAKRVQETWLTRLRVVPHFSSEILEGAKCECAWKSPHARKGKREFFSFFSFFSLPAACHLFSRRVIFPRAHVSLALLSLRKNGGLLVVYSWRTLLCLFTGAHQSSSAVQLTTNRDIWHVCCCSKHS